MKQIFYLLMIALLSFHVTAQPVSNLIPNPSFEDINICHKFTEPCSPKAWRSTVLKNVRYIAYEADKEHFFDAADGQRCISFSVYNEKRRDERSFIQVPLLAQLEAGQQYKISFAFRPEMVLLESFGIYFTDTLLIHADNQTVLQYQPQLVFNANQKIPAHTWKRAEAVYTARGGEQGLIIGNFNSDQNTVVTQLAERKKRDRSRRVFYAFDDFNLQPLANPTTKTDVAVSRDFIYQDSFRHTNRYGVPVVSMITTADSLHFYQRPQPVIRPPKPATVRIANTDIKVNESFVASSINFATNSDRLLPTAFPTLEVVADFLKQHPDFKLKIIGHTDNVGSPLANQKLSEDRARAVVRALMERGVKYKQVIAIGRGETEPLTGNFSEEGRSENRRVEFIFY